MVAGATWELDDGASVDVDAACFDGPGARLADFCSSEAPSVDFGSAIILYKQNLGRNGVEIS